MKGVATRYPAFDDALQRPVDLDDAHPAVPPEAPAAVAVRAGTQRSARAGSVHRDAVPWPADHALCRAAPDALPRSAAPRSTRSASASSTSHARNATTSCAGGKLAGSPIPQGQATGYPVYRLEWQSLGSLQSPASRLHDGSARRAARMGQRGDGRAGTASCFPCPGDAAGVAGGAAIKGAAKRGRQAWCTLTLRDPERRRVKAARATDRCSC